MGRRVAISRDDVSRPISSRPWSRSARGTGTRETTAVIEDIESLAGETVGVLDTTSRNGAHVDAVRNRAAILGYVILGTQGPGDGIAFAEIAAEIGPSNVSSPDALSDRGAVPLSP